MAAKQRTALISLGNDTFICKGDNVLLQPSGVDEGTYSWQDGSTNPFYIVKDTGVYVLTVSNVCGTATRSIKIDQGVCQLYLPNAFTPDYNGLNDIFKVKYPFIVKQFRFTIYNRYGQIIFETNNMLTGWDGNFNGKAQPAGGYVWQISFTDIDNRVKMLTGKVLLIR
jgi:gliding motility-associated-like protein